MTTAINIWFGDLLFFGALNLLIILAGGYPTAMGSHIGAPRVK